MQSVTDLLATSLMTFGVDENVDTHDITNVKIHKSQLYALGPVYSFSYQNSHYYLVEDYSLDNNPTYVRNIIEEINHLLEGALLARPDAMNSEDKYGASINNTEYYLWANPAS
jgi:hypothetical protein